MQKQIKVYKKYKKGFYENFFKIIIALLLLIAAFIIASVVSLRNRAVYTPPFDIVAERSPEETKKMEESFNVFKNTGACVQCDLGRRENYTERRDLRGEIELVRGKG